MRSFKAFAFYFLMLTGVACTQMQHEESFFQSDARHTGFNNTEGITRLHGVKWRYKTAGRIFSSPVVSENTLYIGSDDNSLYALDALNGSLKWKFNTNGRVSSSAAVYGDYVYIVSFDGYLYCLEKKSGVERWKFRSAGERVFAAPGIHGLPEKDKDYDDPWDMFLSSPVVAHGVVYFGCGEGIMYAIDSETGQKKWEFMTNGVIHSSPAYADSTLYFGSWDSYLYAVNKDGLLKWKFKTGEDTIYYNQVGFQSSPVVNNGVVYSGCRDANVWAIDAITGNLRWKYNNNGSWVISTPAIHKDTLYFTTSDTHKFIALDAGTGRELYSGNCKTFGFSSPAVVNGMVYVGNFGGSLMAFDSKNGKSVWEFRTEAAIINNDSILNASGEFNFPKIFRENTYKGSLEAMNTLYSMGSILSSPAVCDGMVYFGSTNGNVYALY